MKKLFLLITALLSSATYAETVPQTSISTLPISQHYKALPFVFALDQVPVEHLANNITRQYVMGADTMLVKWVFKKGAIIPLQKHQSEQITWITQGVVKVLSQGKEFIVRAGEIIIIPSYVPHRFEALEDTVDIDFFAPVRSDWFDKTNATQVKTMTTSPSSSSSTPSGTTETAPTDQDTPGIDTDAVEVDTAGKRG